MPGANLINQIAMTNYVTSTLANGEKVVCQAHYHWFWWAKRILAYGLFAGVAIAFDKLTGIGGGLAAIGVLIALLGLGYAYLRYTNDEIVITNHRVVLKTRILARDVFEMQIQKVETVVVDQTVMGRIFNYGSVACRGTGGTNSAAVEIADPLAFRAAFHNAIKESQDNTRAPYEQLAQALNPVSAQIANPVTAPVEDLRAHAAANLDDEKLDQIISLLKEISQKLDK